MRGMRGMHVFKGGGSESPIYKSYPFDLYEGYAGLACLDGERNSNGLFLFLLGTRGQERRFYNMLYCF